ncbi:peptide/nickel transport system ATP-binding protein [Muricomes intestini]|jgi:peptide/nickel transport system ATP-binding protein|uniref:Peptide/nickel transport system ATP-binding protein n=2 Tax=Muricomes intestini TaxID=1796634 RepID=A0A4R3K664_9FIRM|nr:ABC transporter ATP-binding protein [Muricomes intestini]TCS78336.1 peptide/nickel transport system ATP-binding protein [Muricomes intestini]HAX52440.1 glutathione ABC transporter ATP-binding protein [Lachnospiraceae bacterium]
MSLLSVQNLSVQFHDSYAGGETVRDISFNVEPGEIVGIVGESGSGKSTAMQAIMGLLPKRAEVKCQKLILSQEDITPPFSADGKSAVKEEKLYEKKMESIRGRQISMIFQEPLSYLNPTVKIGRQITEVIHAHDKACTRGGARQRAKELLDMVGIRRPAERMRQYSFELSGGMRQRVATAIALACEPRLLIADEPTTALDVTVQGQILQLIKRISKETGTAVLFVSHDLGVIASVCSRVIVMHNGKIVEEGVTDDIFREPRHMYTKELIEKASHLQKLPHSMVSRNPLFVAEHVTKQYPGRINREQTEAVNNVSFYINKGEIYGLVGESGCGKTTLAGMAAGVYQPTKGNILFKGVPLLKMNRQIQMVFQDVQSSLNPKMTIEDILEEPLQLNTKLSSEGRRKKVIETLNLVGLSPKDTEKYPQAFSGGQRQRIAIARALILEPELMICDEPVSSLDISTQEQILELLEQVQIEKQISCLFISHDLNVVKRISQRLGVMYEGVFVESGNTRSIYEDPWHPYTKTLLSAILPPNPKMAKRKRRMWKVKESGGKKLLGEGCPFAPRCGYAMECCYAQSPKTYTFGERKIACFLYSEEYTGKRNDDYKMTSQI